MTRYTIFGTFCSLISAVSAMASSAHAQNVIYRCGNDYVNTIDADSAKNCKQVSPPLSKDKSVKPQRTSPVADEYLRSAAEPPPAPARKAKELGAIDQWRYESCRQDAAKAPTEAGVRAGLAVCMDKFEQW